VDRALGRNRSTISSRDEDVSVLRVRSSPSSTLPAVDNSNCVSAAYKSATIALTVIAVIAIVIIVLLVLYVVNGLYYLTACLECAANNNSMTMKNKVMYTWCG